MALVSMGMAEVIHMPEQRGPQLEDGYLRISNELQEAITFARLTAYQRSVLDVVIRQTYGFNKLVDDISRSQFEYMTGIDRSSIRRAIDDLVGFGIVTRSEGRYARSYSVNKRHPAWNLPDERKLCNRPPKEGAIHPQVGGDLPPVEGVIYPPGGGDLPPTKDNSKRQHQKTTPKETLSRSLRERFEIFWAAYPKRKSKATAEKAFAKLDPSEQLFKDLVAGLERAKTSADWLNPKFIPHASTWLNAAGWMDELQTAYADAELAMIRAFNTTLGEQIGSIDEAVFVESRAAAIRDFLSFRREKDPDFWKRYFPWVATEVELPPKVGFDWLISREGFTKVIGGQHRKRAAAGGGEASGAWYETTTGTEAKGAELGIAKRDNELPLVYRNRVFKKAGPGPWRERALKEEGRFGADAVERLRAFFEGGNA